jgi:hypothetical protein
MATIHFDIVSGPSVWDLSVGLFDRPAVEVEREVTFRFGNGSFRAKLKRVEKVEGSCEGWVIDAKVTEGVPDLFGKSVKIRYDTKARRGTVEATDQRNPPDFETFYSHGYQIVKANGRVVSILHQDSGQVVNIGQMVTAKVRFEQDLFPIVGGKGIVIRLCEPYTDGCTSDIVHVWFEHNNNVTIAKMKEIKS